MSRKLKRILGNASVFVGTGLFVGSLFRIAEPESIMWWHYAIGGVLGLVVIGLLALLRVCSRVVGLPDTSQNFPPGYLTLFEFGLACFPVGALAFVLIAHGFRTAGFALGVMAVVSGMIVFVLMGITLVRTTLRRVWK